jgi:hypothetical protein
MLTILGSGRPTEIATMVMAVGWAAFGVILILGKRAAAKGSANRDIRSTFGFLLQLAAYAICFVFHRSYFSPIVPMPVSGEAILAALSIVLTVWSVWFCYAAARALGKHWALMAIGLDVSRWQVLAIAVVVFAIGTAIRIHTEEKLLRAAFGVKFQDYAQTVPAFLPFRWR